MVSGSRPAPLAAAADRNPDPGPNHRPQHDERAGEEWQGGGWGSVASHGGYSTSETTKIA